MAENFLSFKERQSYLNRIYPLVKLIWVFCVAVGLFLFKTSLPGAVMFVLILFLALAGGKISPREILKSGIVVFGLGFLLMLFHFFIDPGQVVWSIGLLTVTDTGLQQGPVFFLPSVCDCSGEFYTHMVYGYPGSYDISCKGGDALQIRLHDFSRFEISSFDSEGSGICESRPCYKGQSGRI